MHGEIGALSEEKSDQSSSAVVHDKARADSHKAHSVVKDKSHISQSVDDTCDEIISEISTRSEKDNVLDWGGRLSILWVVFVDVVT